MKILCVEDGSVDIEKIENNGLKDGQVLVYRQGARVPFVLELDMLEKTEKEDIQRLAEWASSDKER